MLKYVQDAVGNLYKLMSDLTSLLW